ncbi:MAG: hypothetical protein IIZ40_00520 [Bacilli bacterium]|nr:hypothetical protein [Bacilli bacterium]
MANWCSHIVERTGFFSSNYYCNASGEEKPLSYKYIDYYCKNNAYHCPTYEEYYGSSGGCFITTVTCGILKKDEDDIVMNNLRKFRDQILQKNDKYSNILKLYDSIGPIVSCNIMHDDNREEIANKIYSKLEGFTSLIENEKYDEATRSYVIMTLKLVKEYGLDNMYRNIRDNNFGYKDNEFDITKAGHGKKVVKTLD